MQRGCDRRKQIMQAVVMLHSSGRLVWHQQRCRMCVQNGTLDAFNAGEKVYMHCWGGRGRSGLVAACLLQSKYGISADESLQHVQQAFQTRGETKHMRVPETDEQVQFVKDFGKTR
jgi:hypothetical protein